MGQLQLDVTVEYVKRLLKGKVKLKNKEMQEKAARTVSENGEGLHNLFVKAVRHYSVIHTPAYIQYTGLCLRMERVCTICLSTR